MGPYLELRNRARHAETMRSNAVNLMLVLAAALISLVSFDGTISSADLGPSTMVTATGVARRQ